VNTKEIVRCDVIIDKITSVSIVTTTKELHLEEAPSKFTLRGYGGKGNEFSTLEGIPFKWWLETPTAETSSVTDPQSIMRFLPFSESLYNAPASISTLEERRLQGSQVLVEGLKTGSANVFAKIQDPVYKVSATVYGLI
jgi:nuclear pore complex protein Nup210